jgi:hypothetical protein
MWITFLSFYLIEKDSARRRLDECYRKWNTIEQQQEKE